MTASELRPPLLINRSLTALAGIAALTAGVLCTTAAEAAPRGVSSPTKGVICDEPANTCFTKEGVSLRDTRKVFGAEAERRLWIKLIGQRPATEISLSNGTRCDLKSETCWVERYGRRRTEWQMSRDLFGRVARNGRKGREVTDYRGRCTLAQNANLLHDGPCSMRLVERRNGVTRYVVSQPDGRRFNFTDRSGRLELTDATGTSAVAFIDHGYTGVFRWRNLTMVATRENQGLRRGRKASDGIGELFSDR